MSGLHFITPSSKSCENPACFFTDFKPRLRLSPGFSEALSHKQWRMARNVMAVIRAAPSGCGDLALCHLFRSLFTRTNFYYLTDFCFVCLSACTFWTVGPWSVADAMRPSDACGSCLSDSAPSRYSLSRRLIQNADNLYLENHKWQCFFHCLWLCPILPPPPMTAQVMPEQEKISEGTDHSKRRAQSNRLVALSGSLVLVSTTTHFTSGREASVFPPLLYLKEVPK